MKPTLPCAIYTRKSSEEGLERDFNSLHAQREACQAFILSQKSEGWKALPEHYDDGGYSGGNMERPALRRLMHEIATGRVKIVVVYKVDRLTRSLADFAKLVEQFDAKEVSFVSVTQQFNTTTSMGRLTLNVLLSFAQFEREVTGERIRDKIAASKRKGMWMGGFVPMGYCSHERTLVIDAPQAERIRAIYKCYLELGRVRELQEELAKKGWTTPVTEGKDRRATGGKHFSRGHLYRILSNPIYLGRISHKGQIYPGNHPAIIDQETWERVQAQLAANCQGKRRRLHAQSPSLLAGKVFDVHGQRLTPTHAAKGGRRYRYYVTHGLVGRSKAGPSAPDHGLRIPALALEEAVLKVMTGLLTSPHDLIEGLHDTEAEVCTALIASAQQQAQSLEQGSDHDRIALVGMLIDQVVVGRDRVDVALRRSALLSHDSSAKLPAITRSTSVRFRRSGLGIRLVIPDQGTAFVPQVDQSLWTFIQRGSGWFRRMVMEGVGPSVIAKEEGVSPSLVQQMLYAAFLAPDIVQLIEGGEQPATLTSRTLLKALPLPARWDEQRKLFGIRSGD